MFKLPLWYFRDEDLRTLQKIIAEANPSPRQKQLLEPLLDAPQSTVSWPQAIRSYNSLHKEEKRVARESIRTQFRRLNDSLENVYEKTWRERNIVLKIGFSRDQGIFFYGLRLPVGIHRDDCFKAGDLVIPARILTSDAYIFEREHFHVSWADCENCQIRKRARCDIQARCQYRPPFDIQSIKDDWSHKCDTSLLKLWNGPLLKLQRIQIDPTREITEREHINLDFCHAEYFDFLASNHQIHLEFLAGISDGIRAKYAPDLDSLRDLHLSLLANTPGLTTLIVHPTFLPKKGPVRYECLLVKRESRSQLAHYPGAWQTSTAGNIHPNKDLRNGLPDPFKAAARESRRELADLQIRASELACLGLSIDLLTGQPEFLFYAETNQPLEQIVHSKESYEQKTIRVVKMPTELCSLLTYEEWAPSNAVCAILTMEKCLTDFTRAKIKFCP